MSISNESSQRITTCESYDRYYTPSTARPLGDLTAKQYAALVKVAELHPDYSFRVVRYVESDQMRGSSAVHIEVFHLGSEHYVGLVGKTCADHYDKSEETAQVVKHIAHYVFHRSV